MSAPSEPSSSAAVDRAREIPDPIVGLVERTVANPGAPLESAVLKRLTALKKEDPASFEELRADLKKAGCRVLVLDKALAKEAGETATRPPKQADILIELSGEAKLFHTAEGAGYADIDVTGHRETWAIRSKGFRRWLVRRFFETTGGAPTSEARQSALDVIEAQAQFDAEEASVHVRVAEQDGKLYLDLGDPGWRAVEIDTDSWRVVDVPPVRFRRAAGIRALPEPARGGSIETLRTFLNVSSDQDFVLVVAWALAVLRAQGPYPILVLSGEQGSAKSTFSRILRLLLDPNTAPLRALPREDRDLFIAATNGHVLTFDNLSGLPPWISDTLCRLATGGGFAVRQLYTDHDEVLFDALRPVVLNGIEDIVTRPDLADRAIFLMLEQIPEERRRTEKEVLTQFEQECPQILGALLDAVSLGLRSLPETRMEKLPRMADFALWVCACEGALWDDGRFMQAYDGNRDDAVDNVIEADSVGSAVREFMAHRTVWAGTATELLVSLSNSVGDTVCRSRSWPTTPRALSGRVRRAATFLRKVGIDISFAKIGRARTRTIRISVRPDSQGMQSSAPSQPSAVYADHTPSNGSSGNAPRTVDMLADANAEGDDPSTVRPVSREIRRLDDADGADTNMPTDSDGWSTRL